MIPQNSTGPQTPRPILAVSLLAAVFLAAGCDSPSPAKAPPSKDDPAKPAPTQTVNLEEIFPPGPGRELVLNNCQSCHVWVPIVILRMDKNAWHRNSMEHRDRVKALSDAEFKTLYNYLTTTFTPDRPIPKLPPALLESWTSY